MPLKKKKTKSRQVLIVTNRIPYPLSDGGVLAIEAMRRLYWLQLGWDVHLLAMRTPRQERLTLDLVTTTSKLASYSAVPVDTRVKLIPTALNFLASRKPSHEVRHHSAAFASTLAETVRRLAPEVVQFESVFLAPYLPVVREASPHSVAVLRVHNAEHQVWSRYAAAARGPKRMYMRSLARRVRKFEEAWWPRFDALLPLTDEDAAQISPHRGCAHVHVVPFSTPPMHHLGEPPAWEGYHLGAMDWLPNVQAMDWFVADVWPAIHAAAPDFRFHFAGKAMPGRFLRHQGPVLFCHGEVQHPEEISGANRILLVPLLSGGGVRIKILEAMAKEQVVIATSVAIQGIAAQPRVHFLLADTPAAFAQAVQWCLSHRDEAAALGRAAKEFITAHYAPDVVGRILQESLDPLIAGRFSNGA